MKTFKILFIILLSLMLAQTSKAALMAPTQESLPSDTKSKNTGNLVRAVLHNGVYMAVVDLPCVEVFSTKAGSRILSGQFSNGKYVAQVDLPVIEITASQTGGRKLPGFERNGEIIAIAELPLIEIESEFPYNHLLAISEGEVSNLPVVNLPEIIISPYTSENYIVSAITSDGILMPSLNLQTVEISSEFSRFLTTSTNEFAFENKEIEWIYISLQNCGITLRNTIVCAVATTMKNHTPFSISKSSGN